MFSTQADERADATSMTQQARLQGMDDGNDLVARARVFAERMHAGQRRKYGGEPFFAHLERVAGILVAHGHEAPAMLAAAYLHDTVEDTDATMQDILDRFGEEVAELVYWLTDAEQGRRVTRKLMSAWRLGGAPWPAKLIKLADLIDNSADIVRADRNFAPVYLAEKIRILDAMLRTEGERIAGLALFIEAGRIRGVE